MNINNVECIDLSFEGLGVVKDQKYGVIFVENLLIGEIANIQIISQTKKMTRAKVTQLVKKSEKRIDKYADYQDLAHLAYDEQINFKNLISQKIFKDYQVDPLTSPQTTNNYRNKTKMNILSDPQNKKYSINYFAKKSNEMLEHNELNIVDKKIHLQIINYIQANFEYFGELESITVRSNQLNEIVIKIIKSQNDNLKPTFTSNIEKLKSEFTQIINVIIADTNNNTYFKLTNEQLTETILDTKFKCGVDQFLQVNFETMELLYQNVIELINPKNKLIDGYCGIGTIGIIGAKKNKTSLAGLEISRESIKLAKQNAKINEIEDYQFLTGDVEKNIQKLHNINSYNTLVVDPPRSGLSNKTINYLNETKLEQIIYISCNAITLLRDLKKLSQNYIVQVIKPFDMFPNTHHVETVVLMSRVDK